MNNIYLITGLAIGSECGACNATNYNYEWLIRQPSSFIWADKLLIPKDIYNTIKNKGYPDYGGKLSKSIKLIFDIAESENLIEIISINDIIDQRAISIIESEINNDILQFKKQFDEFTMPDEKDNHIYQFGENQFCIPSITSLYISLGVSRHYEANCMLSEHEHHYLLRKYGISGLPTNADQEKKRVYNSVFSAILPNEAIFPNIVYENNEKCKRCSKRKECENVYEKHIEERFQNMLKIREYDEIHQLKQTLNELIQKRDTFSEMLNAEDILNDFKTKQKTINKRLNKLFPEVKRWSNMLAIASAPIAFIGVVTNKSEYIIPGAAAYTASVVSKNIIEYLKSKYSWITFVNRGNKV